MSGWTSYILLNIPFAGVVKLSMYIGSIHYLLIQIFGLILSQFTLPYLCTCADVKPISFPWESLVFPSVYIGFNVPFPSPEKISMYCRDLFHTSVKTYQPSNIVNLMKRLSLTSKEFQWLKNKEYLNFKVHNAASWLLCQNLVISTSWNYKQYNLETLKNIFWLYSIAFSESDCVYFWRKNWNIYGKRILELPFLEFSMTSTPNCTMSPLKSSLGGLSSDPLLRRWLLINVPLLLFVSCRKNWKQKEQLTILYSNNLNDYILRSANLSFF